MEKLRIDNPYNRGTEIDFSDNEPLLKPSNWVSIPAPDDNYHQVTDYDTLDTLAFEFYGNSKYFWILAIANNMINPFGLIAGTSIRIPNINTFRNQNP